ncbi:sensor histidine kinase [Sediminihabitans luteus]|uniref:sensor histidine kinase n=1 Tax=Sediminihabitans luteus TaxID=1138585 RepID=UPI0014732257|nr:sensor histidine kinase [Sediminihabitans luteus]
MSVRGKILAAIAVPVIVLFLAAAYISVGAVGDARRASQTAALVDALATQDAAGKALAAERGLTLAGARVDGQSADELKAARQVTDRALRARDAAFEDLSVSALDDRVGAAIDRTISDGDQLLNLRRTIDDDVTPELYSTALYTAFIERAIGVQDELANTTADRELARYLEAYTLLDESMAQDTVELPLVGALLGMDSESDAYPAATARIALLVAQDDDLYAETQRAVRDLNDSDLSYPATSAAFANIRSLLAASNPGAVTADMATNWGKTSAEHLANLTKVRDATRNSAGDIAEADSTAETTTAVVTTLVTLAAIIGSILLAGFIGSRIVNPLRRLTAAAADVRDQLPTLVEQVAVPGQGPSIDIAPIEIESSDEVGQLARAFNDVNSTTIQTAREQAALRGSIAEMFVNVARRDQVLLNRQLAFLDDLERAEEDASTLSNLFRLDHLATRMRRNAESLLVLAGIDSGRRVRQPMPASDVIRTASSEIELYDRVRLNLAVDPQMLGHNALNAAHLLAELLENATNFSEPHTPVEVSIAQDDRGVHVSIRDHGLGMTNEEIVEASRKVSVHAATEVVGAQRLGLFVVGRLADRLSANVSFFACPDGGTEVTVTFPPALFVAASSVPLPQPTDPLDQRTQTAAGQLAAGPQSAALPVRGGGPVTGAMPAATGSTPTVDEAPLVKAVDLDALTDGTTAGGMPRRRSRSVDTGTSAPSASLASGPTTGSIVLPPLAAPSLPDDLPSSDQDEAWAPPAEVQPSASGLPSRAARRTAEPTVALEAEVSNPVSLPGAEAVESIEVPVLEVSERSAMFSSFRSMGAMSTEVSEQAHDFEAAAEQAGPLGGELREVAATSETDLTREFDEVARPLTDAVPTVGGFGDGRTWAPQPAETQPAPAQPAEAWAPAGVEQWAPQGTPSASGEQSGWAPAQQPASEQPAVEQTAIQPAVAQPAAQAAPAEQQAGPADASQGEEVPEALRFDALPRFEELMTDLPTRRSLRESSAARRRGLFGRRPRTEETPVVPAASVVREAPAEQVASAPVALNVPAQPEPAAPVSVWSPQPAATDAPLAQRESLVQREAPAQPLVRRESAFSAQVAVDDTPQPAAWNPPAPLQRRTPQEQALEVPIDPDYIHDSVEARSEWMASAVLYEEMTALMRANERGDGPLSSSAHEEYRPQVEYSQDANLRRRGGRPQAAPAGPFSAQIERDPEQLRSRLSAFQSGMSRGRAELGGDQDSTAPGMTMNDVPDSAASTR